MILNRIQITFGSLSKITGPTISYQYDVVQYLVIKGLDLPAVYRVDFCNEGDAQTISMTGGADGVAIPDQLLLTGKKIKAYIMLTGTDEGAVETRYEAILPVNSRPAPSDIEPTPAEQQQIDQLVLAMNQAVEDSRASAEESERQAGIAEDKANEAESKATLAESWAVGGTGTRQGEDTNNSEFWSRMAHEAASKDGWVYFYIDDEDVLHYVKTENSALSFYIDALGILHVTNA